MLKSLALLACVLLGATAVFAADVPKIAPAEAAKLVTAGQAVLIDVREAAEWKETGVAAPATLLAKSDFDGAKKEWTPFLAKLSKDKTVVLYCRSGKRASVVGAALAAEGYKVVNAGGLKDWSEAGLPVRKVE